MVFRSTIRNCQSTLIATLIEALLALEWSVYHTALVVSSCSSYCRTNSPTYSHWLSPISFLFCHHKSRQSPYTVYNTGDSVLQKFLFVTYSHWRQLAYLLFPHIVTVKTEMFLILFSHCFWFAHFQKLYFRPSRSLTGFQNFTTIRGVSPIFKVRNKSTFRHQSSCY